ncbi:MAG: right-handed parallel beta-helix repeat-containing protein [Candidatus Lokiarchaeota archaeon]|nr:right-handed parallel beta-helix repeat-containing protein [Candidatus Lokiarchaeota archaeon]
MDYQHNILIERPKISVVHELISIDGNADFHTQALNEGWSGNGTVGNPYVIEDYIITNNRSNQHVIYIQNTNVYFIIQNVTVKITRYAFDKSGYYLNNVKNGELRNNTATGTDPFHFFYGFYLQNSTNNILTGNDVNNTYKGFILNNSSNNLLMDNIAVTNYYGFCFHSSANNTFMENTVNNNYRVGLHLYNSANNTLTENLFNNNGILIESDTIEKSIQNVVENNTVNEKDLIYLQNEVSIIISSDAGQVILVNCSSIQIKNIIIETKASVPFLLLFSVNISITNSTANNNYYGFYLQYSTNSFLTGNTANNNDDSGFHLWYSTNNTLLSNNANDNSKGIYLQYSTNNTLTSNKPNENRDGIYLYTSPNNILTDNVLVNNGFGMLSYTVEDSIQALVRNNTINQKDLIYLQYGMDNVISSEVGQIILVNCSSLRIENLVFEERISTAFSLHFSTNISIINNTFNSVFTGLHLWFSNNNTLIGNTACNSINGFTLYTSTNNTLLDNTASNNHIGFFLYASSNNTLINNIANYNYEYGIYLGLSNYNKIRGNTLLYSGNDCIVQFDCIGNIILDNICEDDGTIISSYNLVFILGILALVSLIYIKKRYIKNK